MTVVRTFVAALSGAVTALLAWLVLVPWDLSEVATDGRTIEGGGDDSGPQIALVGVVVVAIGLMAIARHATRGYAPTYVAGGLAAWTSLFAWRAGTSETSGANMFMVPVVMAFIPLTIVTPLILRAAASWVSRA